MVVVKGLERKQAQGVAAEAKAIEEEEEIEVVETIPIAEVAMMVVVIEDVGEIDH